MKQIQTYSNLLILNPLFSADPKIFEPHIESFQMAMRMINEQPELKVSKIFMLVDTPMVLKKNPMFKSTNDARQAKGEFGLKHLGQFIDQIQGPYLALLATNGLQAENINIITEANAVKTAEKIAATGAWLPACRKTVKKSVSCGAIIAAAVETSLQPRGGVGVLRIVAQFDQERLPKDLVMEGVLAAGKLPGNSGIEFFLHDSKANIEEAIRL